MSYDVVITREGDDWIADVPSVPGAHTFARSLPGLLTGVREAIILMDDLADDAEPELSTRYDVSDTLVTGAVAVAVERRELSDRTALVQDHTNTAIRSLTAAGYSVRDTAVLAGVTPGRVSQIAPRKLSLLV